MSGRDDAGTPSSGEVRLTLEVGATRVLTARDIERGATGLAGSLGTASATGGC